MIKRLLTLLLLLSHFALAQPKSPPQQELFHRTSGWTGADGTYSISFSPNSVLWGFSDTFFGEVKEGRRLEPYRFVNNSAVWQTQMETRFLTAPVFVPPDGNGWFWLFDGFAVDSEGRGEILLGQFEKTGGGGAFGFAQTGLWWARFQVLPNEERIEVLEYRKLPFFTDDGGTLITFGPALMEEGPWLYLYGIKQEGMKRHALVARAPKQSLGWAGTWRFFDGQSWQADVSAGATIFEGAGLEFSVYKARNGRYLYLGGAENGMSADVVVRRAASPTGPWEEPERIYTAPEHGGTVFCYNAKAHPEISPEGKVLVSYNVNTTDLVELIEDAGIYRPRFFWWTPSDPNWLPKEAPR